MIVPHIKVTVPAFVWIILIKDKVEIMCMIEKHNLYRLND